MPENKSGPAASVMVGAIIAVLNTSRRLRLLESLSGYVQVPEYRTDGAGPQITTAPVGDRRPGSADDIYPNLVVAAALAVKSVTQST